MKVDLWIALLVGVVPLLVAVFSYFANKRSIDKKANNDEVDSIVDNTDKIRKMSSELLNEAEERWKKKFEEQDKDFGEKMGKLRQRLEDENRQQVAELLVKMEEQKERNSDLKLQIAELGGYVQGATGDIYKRFPLEKPKGK